MTEEEAMDDVANPKQKQCKVCGEPVVCRNLCVKHYGKSIRTKKIETKKYTTKKTDDDFALTSFLVSGKSEEDTRTFDEYLSDRYDYELLWAIKHYKKTGKVVDSCADTFVIPKNRRNR